MEQDSLPTLFSFERILVHSAVIKFLREWKEEENTGRPPLIVSPAVNTWVHIRDTRTKSCKRVYLIKTKTDQHFLLYAFLFSAYIYASIVFYMQHVQPILVQMQDTRAFLILIDPKLSVTRKYRHSRAHEEACRKKTLSRGWLLPYIN